MKKFILIFFVLTLYGCGFNPIYNASNEIKYKILVNETTGDRFINNIVRDEIYKISNKDSKEILEINFNTDYEKIILSNDIKGSPSEFQVIAKTTFDIIYDDKIIKNDFNEKQIFKNTSDFFGQKNYEENIKQNFARSIARKFNLGLLTIK